MTLMSMSTFFEKPLMIILIIAIVACIVTGIQTAIQIYKTSKKPNPCGIIYVKENAKRDEPSFRCEVSDDFFEAAFSNQQAYVIFEIRKE